MEAVKGCVLKKKLVTQPLFIGTRLSIALKLKKVKTETMRDGRFFNSVECIWLNAIISNFGRTLTVWFWKI